MKRFVIKKYIMAKSAAHALRIESKVKADDCWVDEKQPEPQPEPQPLIGFDLSPSEYYYSPVIKRKKKK